MDKKYELIKDDFIIYGRREKTLYRIRALKDFDDVKKGDVGGYIESEKNLSHEGKCWIYDKDAKVYEDASILGNAKIHGICLIKGHSKITDDAKINGVYMTDYAVVHMNAEVSGLVRISENANISGTAKVHDRARIYGHSKIYGNAEVYGDANISEYSNICGDAKVYDYAYVYGHSTITSDAKVCGNVNINGNTHISKNAIIENVHDYFTIGYIGNYNLITAYKTKSGNINIDLIDFNRYLITIPLYDFENNSRIIFKDPDYTKEYLHAIELIKVHFEYN